MRRALKVAAVTLAAVVVIVGVTVAWLAWSPRRVPAGQPALTTLGSDSLPAFRRTFNEAKGEVRILALLSPT